VKPSTAPRLADLIPASRVAADPLRDKHDETKREREERPEPFCLSDRIEHLLDRCREVPRERQRERQRGRVALRLDRVDRLPRDIDRGRELPLRQPTLGSQLAHPVLHLAGARS
jgi:hypothetical protein